MLDFYDVSRLDIIVYLLNTPKIVIETKTHKAL